MNTKTAELKQMIEGAIRCTSPNMRRKALKACMWRLRGPNGEYVGLNADKTACPVIAFVPESRALIFDGRDNEDMKLRTYEAVLGELTIEIVPQICAA